MTKLELATDIISLVMANEAEAHRHGRLRSFYLLNQCRKFFGYDLLDNEDWEAYAEKWGIEKT